MEEEEIDTDEFHEILGLRGYNASFKTNYEWVQNNEEVMGILTVRDTPEKYIQSWSVAAPFVQLLEHPWIVFKPLLLVLRSFPWIVFMPLLLSL